MNNCVFILSQLLFVGVGHQITACYKKEVYKLPIIKAMVDALPVDAIFLQPSDDIREDPFVLPDVLGYLGMPDPAPSDLNRLVGIVKLARWASIVYSAFYYMPKRAFNISVLPTDIQATWL